MSTVDKITKNYLDGKMSEQGYLAALQAIAKISGESEPEQVSNTPQSKPDPANATTGVEIYAKQGKNKILLGTVRQFRQRGGLYWVDKVLICANATLQGHDLRTFERNAVTSSGKSVGTWRVMPDGKGCRENDINPYERPQEAISKLMSLDMYDSRTAVVLPFENGNEPEKVRVSVNVPTPPSKRQAANVPQPPSKAKELPTISIHDWRRNAYPHLATPAFTEQGWSLDEQHAEAKTAQAKLAQAKISVPGKVTTTSYGDLIMLAVANDLM